MNYRISDKWFYFLIITFGVYFLYRLIDQSQIIKVFPLDYTNDMSSYMAILFFLVKYGFHNISPHWYNGYPILLTYPPAWFFFTLPIYYLFKDVKTASFVSLILMYIILFVLIYYIGEVKKISKLRRLVFFLFLFANPIAIGTFIRAGRYIELFGWVSFILLSLIILYYKDRKLDKKFLWFIPSYGLLLISHPCVAIPAHFLVLSLFLIKKWREKIWIVLSGFGGIIISSFWLFPFLKNIFSTVSLNGMTQFTNELISLKGKFLLSNIASFVVPIVLWIVFYYYWSSKNKSKKELLFFSPILLLSILFVTRSVVWTPILDAVFPDVYLTFFIFFIAFYFLSIKEYTFLFKKIVLLALFIIPIISIAVSIVHTPFFIGHTQLEKDTISLLPKVDDKFLMFGGGETSYSRAYYSFTPIYYNLSTADGWSWSELDQDYINLLNNNFNYLRNKECEKFINTTKVLNVTNLIGYDKYCDNLEYCKLKKVLIKNRVCLYKLK